jgi:hypothetical protein
MTDEYKLTGIVCARPQQFAWFLGAGASAAAGLPTAWDFGRSVPGNGSGQGSARLASMILIIWAVTMGAYAEGSS